MAVAAFVLQWPSCGEDEALKDYTIFSPISFISNVELSPASALTMNKQLDWNYLKSVHYQELLDTLQPIRIENSSDHGIWCSII